MSDKSESSAICLRLQPAFLALLTAHDYALDTESNVWEFAVSIQELGITHTDLRWLVRKGFVEHAREVTVEGDDGREFRPEGNLTFCPQTCFVLSDVGVSTARSIKQNKSRTIALHPRNGESDADLTPQWDGEHRELRLNGSIVKRFKWQAANQEIVLSAFQEEGWPIVIDDPLPPQPEQDPKRRLNDTIKALNRHQETPIIRFHGNGTGEGIRWELLDGDESKRS